MGLESVYYKPMLLLHVLEVICPLIFVIGMYINISMWRQGKAPIFKKKVSLSMMFKALIFNVMLQTQILKLSAVRWVMHMLIFYGFMGLAATYWWPWFFHDVMPLTYFTEGPGILVMGFVNDFFGMLLLAGTTIAIIRRFIVKPEILDTLLQDTVAVVSLFSIVVMGFFLEAMRISLEASAADWNLSYIGYALSFMFSGDATTKTIATTLWIIHTISSFALIAYIPFSKLIHIIASPLNNVINATEEAGKEELYGFWARRQAE